MVSEDASGWSTEELVDLLEEVDLFAGLPPEDIDRVAGLVERRALERDEILFREGEPGDAFYIVFTGAVEISKSRPDGAADRLAVRRAGEGFGEMALLNDAPRSATARASEPTVLIMVRREDFDGLLGGDSLALRMMRALSRALRALGVRFASMEMMDPGASARSEEHALSRAMQSAMIPRAAPRVTGYELAAGTTRESQGRGGSVWDWTTLEDGRTALVTLDVHGDGLPPAHHLGTARAVLRGMAGHRATVPELLAGANDALSSSAIEGLDQFVEAGILVVGGRGLEWAGAGRVPAGILRRDGSMEELGSQGPPLGVMGGFKYDSRRIELDVGDAAFVLSHGSPGLFLGAADLVAQLHGKPAGEVVSTLHKAIRRAQGEQRTETSVLYARRA